jgi:hypothetical protein
VVLSFGVIAALLLGSRVILKPGSSSGSVSAAPGSARAVASRTDSSGPTDAEAQARRESLERNAQERDPMSTAIRAVVGPRLSEEDLDALSREVNLLCVGSTTAQAVTALIEEGMDRATAKTLITKACALA